VPCFPDQRILALRARSFEEGKVPFASHKEAADECPAAIKEREPFFLFLFPEDVLVV
jgi:thioesterase domain-containing protein